MSPVLDAPNSAILTGLYPSAPSEAALIRPGRYRRKSPTVEAVRVTPDNVDDVAVLVEGRTIRNPGQPPQIRMRHSIHPALVGDYVKREGDTQPWHPILALWFEAGFDLVCDNCGR